MVAFLDWFNEERLCLSNMRTLFIKTYDDSEHPNINIVNKFVVTYYIYLVETKRKNPWLSPNHMCSINFILSSTWYCIALTRLAEPSSEIKQIKMQFYSFFTSFGWCVYLVIGKRREKKHVGHHFELTWDLCNDNLQNKHDVDKRYFSFDYIQSVLDVVYGST